MSGKQEWQARVASAATNRVTSGAISPVADEAGRLPAGLSEDHADPVGWPCATVVCRMRDSDQMEEP